MGRHSMQKEKHVVVVGKEVDSIPGEKKKKSISNLLKCRRPVKPRTENEGRP